MNLPVSLTRLSSVKSLLRELKVSPSKSMGQNFLVDRNILHILTTLAELKQTDSVLEIGPGLGVVTRELLNSATRIVVIEKDLRFCSYLQDSLGCYLTFKLIEGDALDADLEGILAGGCRKVVSNLPYSAGTRILIRLITAPVNPELCVVTVQKDVADRMVAKPSCKDYGLLSICAQLHYEVSIKRVISPGCFYPRPRVESAIVKLVRKPHALVEGLDASFYLNILRRMFSGRRKKMSTLLSRINSMKKTEAFEFIERLNIDPGSRPENLSPEEWAYLLKEMAKRMD